MTDLELVAMAQLALKFDSEAASAPWTAERNESKKSISVHSGKPWRRRPSKARGQWASMTDVLTMTGGFSEDAQVNANHVTFAREALAELALWGLRQYFDNQGLTKEDVLACSTQQLDRPLKDFELTKLIR